MADQDFRDGNFDTKFMERYMPPAKKKEAQVKEGSAA
jgi:hypothetical protein